MVHLVVIGTGLLYVVIGRLVNERNAAQLLSGYNTMSREEQERFDLRGYLKIFHAFFLYLGLGSIAVFYFAYLILGNPWASRIWLGAQILSFFYLVYQGYRFKRRV